MPTLSISRRQHMRKILSLLLVGIIALASTAPLAADPASVPASKQTELELYLTPQEAFDMIQADPDGVLFLDVRTRAEAVYVGMPTVVDALVPFVDHDPFWPWDEKRDSYKLEPVQEFVPESNRRLADKHLSKDDPVIVMCRSGGRSAMAADRLAEDGFTNVYSVIEGFEGDKAKSGDDKGKRTLNGWKNAGLP